MTSSQVGRVSRSPETGSAIAARRAGWLTLAGVVALAITLSASSHAQAAGRYLPEDTGRIEFTTSQRAAGDTRAPSAFGAKTEMFGIRPYIEYGITDRIAIGLGTETQLTKIGLENNRPGRTDGVMNTELFLRGRLYDQDWYMVSVQDMVRLPGQDTAGLTQAASSLRLQYGRSGTIGGGNWTSAIKSGLHLSFDHTPDKFHTNVSFGWRPTERWQFTIESRNTLAFDSRRDGGMPSLEGAGSSVGQVSVVHALSSALSVQVGGWQTVSGGSGQPHGYDILVWLRF